MGFPHTPVLLCGTVPHHPIQEEERGEKMKESIIKKKSGQSGSTDTNIYVRQHRLEIRVSHQERKRIIQNSIDKGFDTTAQFIRCQAMNPGQAENPNALRQAQLACQFQLNKLGNNVNQIARFLNSGNKPDDEILLCLLQIQEHAESILKKANEKSGTKQ